MFKDKPISRATIFLVLKDCQDGKKQKNKKNRTLTKNNISYRKRKRAQKYSARQLGIKPKCCRALRDTHCANGGSIVLDDESYFTFSHHELCGNYVYYKENFETTPDNVKYAGKTKFEPKVLFWLAISSKGIRPRGAKAINADIYIDQCLSKLKQFIERKHTQDEIMF